MKPDWIIHAVCCEHPTFHTHGLRRHGSLELELNLPLNHKQAAQFINLIAAEVAEQGKRYQSGERIDDVFTLPFYLLQTQAVHNSRPDDQVLRILFCDPALKYPWEDGCQAPYADQLDGEERIAMPALLAKKAAPVQ